MDSSALLWTSCRSRRRGLTLASVGLSVALRVSAEAVDIFLSVVINLVRFRKFSNPMRATNRGLPSLRRRRTCRSLQRTFPPHEDEPGQPSNHPRANSAEPDVQASSSSRAACTVKSRLSRYGYTGGAQSRCLRSQAGRADSAWKSAKKLRPTLPYIHTRLTSCAPACRSLGLSSPDGTYRARLATCAPNQIEHVRVLSATRRVGMLHRLKWLGDAPTASSPDRAIAVVGRCWPACTPSSKRSRSAAQTVVA